MALKNFELVPASLIADTLEIPKPSVVKILGLMSQSGIIETGTGKKGGVRLAQGAERFTLLDLFISIEGQNALFRNDHTFKATGDRPTQARKAVSNLFASIESNFKESLKDVLLADLVPDNV